MPTISQIKEQAVTDTPMLLFDCVLADGSTEFWGTHGVSYQGNTYEARVLRHNVFELRAGSDEGIDAAARVSVALANADGHFSQVERNVGWRGTKVTVRFVFFDLVAGQATSESMVVFRGVANAPDEITESALRLTFGNRLNLQRVLLPEVRIQRRCPWAFPGTVAQRQEALDGGSKGKFSPFYRCGYSADLAGGVGSLNGGAPFTTCDYTRPQCEARGMFAAGRFGGIEFVPATTMVRSYGEKGSHAAPVVENEARYNDFVPLVYGTAWYEPPVVFSRNDGNLTRMEVLLGMGEIHGVEKVVVNGVELPLGVGGKDMTATGWFEVVTNGGRNGQFDPNFTDGNGNPLGDPYGSMALLSVVAPNRIANGESLAKVGVLAEGMLLGVYDGSGGLTGEVFTNNPAWVMLDVLRRTGWDVSELDVVSFATAAAYCDGLVAARDLHGNAITVKRAECNLVVRRRRSVAEVLRGIRNAAGLLLRYGSDGRLQLQVEGTFALQQGVQPAGSNSGQTLNGGWPAYEFGDGTNGTTGILRKDNGEPALRVWSRSSADAPNRFSLEFQDSQNEYQQDSLSLVDVDDVVRTGQEVSASFAGLGLAGFQQAWRMLRRQLDKSIRGNRYVDFATSVRGVEVRPGDLIAMTYLREGWQRQGFRVVRVAPGLNYGSLEITAQIHDDGWYAESAVTNGGGRRQPGSGVGLPRPLLGNTVDGSGVAQFGVVETPIVDRDGSASVVLSVGFVAPPAPALTGVGIPLLSLAARVAPTGGTIGGGQAMYYAVSAIDAAGQESPLSFVVRVTVPAGTNTNQVTLTGLSFSSTTAGFQVYRGPSPQELRRIAHGVSVAATYTDGGAAGELEAPPDENYDHANFYWRMELQPALGVTVHSANTVGSSALGMTLNEYRGATVRVMSGTGAGQERTVTSNTATTLTVNPKWSVEPDGTSMFTVAEGSWRFGATSEASPVEFEVPNRKDVTVQISGRAANVRDEETGLELSPVTRWRIGGSVGSELDSDVPGAPVFGLGSVGQGMVELVGVSFADLTNTRTVNSGTLSVYYWNELSGASSFVLGSAMAAGDTNLALNVAGSASVGDLVQVDGEVMVVSSIGSGGLSYGVSRGTYGSTVAAHASGTVVYPLQRRVFVAPFPRDFFGSPASGSFAHRVFLPDARVGAAELFVTNSQGNSPVTRKSYTGTTDLGMRTLSGGQFTIQVEGYLAIQDNAAPPLVVEDAHAVRDVFATLKEAPAGGPVQLRLRLNGTAFCDLTIADGATVSNTVNGFGLGVLGAKGVLTLDVVSVVATANSTPGRDLTVTVRL